MVLSTVQYKCAVGDGCCVCVCVCVCACKALIACDSVFSRGFDFFQNEDTHQPPH